MASVEKKELVEVTHPRSHSLMLARRISVNFYLISNSLQIIRYYVLNRLRDWSHTNTSSVLSFWIDYAGYFPDLTRPVLRCDRLDYWIFEVLCGFRFRANRCIRWNCNSRCYFINIGTVKFVISLVLLFGSTTQVTVRWRKVRLTGCQFLAWSKL